MLGCDLIEIDRIKASVEKYGEHFIKRILSSREIDIYNKRNGNVSFFLPVGLRQRSPYLNPLRQG